VSRRHELTDAEWALIRPLMPPPSRCRAWADHRRTVSGVLF
jgi:transposase